MTMVRRTKRPKHSRKRLDLTAFKEAIADGRVHTAIALVTDEDADSHFELDGEDLLIEVELIPSEQRITARMGVMGAGAGQGVWFVPPVGSEVAVLIPEGELACGAIIVGVLSTGSLPGGIAPGVTVIANSSKVQIHDGSPTGVEGVIKATPYDQHVHPTGTGPSGVPNNAGAANTTILEAK